MWTGGGPKPYMRADPPVKVKNKVKVPPRLKPDFSVVDSLERYSRTTNGVVSPTQKRKKTPDTESRSATPKGRVPPRAASAGSDRLFGVLGQSIETIPDPRTDRPGSAMRPTEKWMTVQGHDASVTARDDVWNSSVPFDPDNTEEDQEKISFAVPSTGLMGPGQGGDSDLPSQSSFVQKTRDAIRSATEIGEACDDGPLDTEPVDVSRITADPSASSMVIRDDDAENGTNDMQSGLVEVAPPDESAFLDRELKERDVMRRSVSPVPGGGLSPTPTTAGKIIHEQLQQQLSPKTNVDQSRMIYTSGVKKLGVPPQFVGHDCPTDVDNESKRVRFRREETGVEYLPGDPNYTDEATMLTLAQQLTDLSEILLELGQSSLDHLFKVCTDIKPQFNDMIRTSLDRAIGRTTNEEGMQTDFVRIVEAITRTGSQASVLNISTGSRRPSIHRKSVSELPNHSPEHAASIAQQVSFSNDHLELTSTDQSSPSMVNAAMSEGLHSRQESMHSTAHAMSSHGDFSGHVSMRTSRKDSFVIDEDDCNATEVHVAVIEGSAMSDAFEIDDIVTEEQQKAASTMAHFSEPQTAEELALIDRSRSSIQQRQDVLTKLDGYSLAGLKGSMKIQENSMWNTATTPETVLALLKPTPLLKRDDSDSYWKIRLMDIGKMTHEESRLAELVSLYEEFLSESMNIAMRIVNELFFESSEAMYCPAADGNYYVDGLCFEMGCDEEGDPSHAALRCERQAVMATWSSLPRTYVPSFMTIIDFRGHRVACTVDDGSSVETLEAGVVLGEHGPYYVTSKSMAMRIELDAYLKSLNMASGISVIGGEHIPLVSPAGVQIHQRDGMSWLSNARTLFPLEAEPDLSGKMDVWKRVRPELMKHAQKPLVADVHMPWKVTTEPMYESTAKQILQLISDAKDRVVTLFENNESHALLEKYPKSLNPFDILHSEGLSGRHALKVRENTSFHSPWPQVLLCDVVARTMKCIIREKIRAVCQRSGYQISTSFVVEILVGFINTYFGPLEDRQIWEDILAKVNKKYGQMHDIAAATVLRSRLRGEGMYNIIIRLSDMVGFSIDEKVLNAMEASKNDIGSFTPILCITDVSDSARVKPLPFRSTIKGRLHHELALLRSQAFRPGHVKAASESYLRALSMNADDIMANVYYSQFLAAVENKREDARDRMANALQHRPFLGRFLATFAEISFDFFSNHNEAEFYFNLAREKDSTDIFVLSRYARFLIDGKRDLTEAKSVARTMLEVHPAHMESYYTNARILIAEEAPFQTVRSELDAALHATTRYSPKWVGNCSFLHLLYAKFLESRKRDIDAEDRYKYALQEDRANVEALEGYVKYLRIVKEDEDAAQAVIDESPVKLPSVTLHKLEKLRRNLEDRQQRSTAGTDETDDEEDSEDHDGFPDTTGITTSTALPEKGTPSDQVSTEITGSEGAPEQASG